MRCFLLLLVPAAVSAATPTTSSIVEIFTVGATGTPGPRPSTIPEAGPKCCDGGVADPSGTCKFFGLNSYCCSLQPSNVGKGCDGQSVFSTGRDVQYFPVVNSDCTGGFIGCAQ
ncbi:hypothetical protein LX32DRAFT_442292 [Colletotrichum zoysiae]|uniref:Hydrophobin n=1 Tax=Colletotrichum zoysiae TaxID=1216348 RepID=A0AAD9M5K9_9PEZI|nr:hypothetical protein LX32DRAFT_442292 [Colletotrichum zoysiae]